MTLIVNIEDEILGQQNGMTGAVAEKFGLRNWAQGQRTFLPIHTDFRSLLAGLG